MGGYSLSNSVKYIEPNKHVLVCGRTGTGKSYLCEKYLTGYDYVVKLDTKNETEERYEAGLSPWDGLEEGVDFSVAYKLSDLNKIETQKIIYVPSYDEQNEDTFNQFFRWIFERKNTILWIDELMSIGTQSKYPAELGRIMQQGRSKGIGVWSCTQRPSGIPTIVPANCSYFFIFSLSNDADRKKCVQMTGIEEVKNPPSGYNFWYYKMGDETAHLAHLVE